MPLTPMNAELLSVRDLSVSFRLPEGEMTAVDRVSFDVRPGEVLGIVGESGSGKSQILFSLMGLLAANGRVSGQAVFQGQDLLALSPTALDQVRGVSLSMIFQDPMTSLNPYMRVGDQLAEGLRVHKGMSRDMAWDAAVAMLDRVRIPDAKSRARRYPHEFSGGMRQRVMIAMALLVRPALLLADEPTTALDVTIQAQVLDLMVELGRDFGTAIILVTHDLGVVARMCDRVLVLYGGRIMEEGRAEALFDAPRHPYAQGLLAATPRLTDALTARLGTIPGTPRSGGAMLPGCPFSPRCTVKVAACEVTQPPLRGWGCLSSGGGAMSLLQVNHLDVGYPVAGAGLFSASRILPIVHDVNLTLEAGRTLGVVGESGCGKSTLGRALIRLIAPTGGQVLWQGQRHGGDGRGRIAPGAPCVPDHLSGPGGRP